MQLKPIFPIAAGFALLLQASCAGPSAGESSKPWTALFDGETTAGWVNYGKDSISDGWQAVDGELTMVGGGGDIVTVGTYQDFELEIEWKLAPGGNSGIFFNVVDGENAVYFSGPEMQVLDNATHNDGKNTLTSSGACYALYKAASDTTKPSGEWNAVRIVSQAGHVEHWQNGVLLCEYTIGSPDWNERVAASKFKDMPAFGKANSGRIALQDHGDSVAYRNIRIR
jgi:hypothetical protein